MQLRFIRFLFPVLIIMIPVLSPSKINEDPIPFTIIENGDNDIPVYKWEEFSKFLEPVNDTIYILNFWATWCSPCVKELPEFEKVSKMYADKKVKVILVSLDLKRMWDLQLRSFINVNEIKSKVVVLYEVDANKWIDKIDNKWSGSIPATLFIKGNDKFFHEGQMTKDEIISRIDSLY